jgi:hypothetical protein
MLARDGGGGGPDGGGEGAGPDGGGEVQMLVRMAVGVQMRVRMAVGRRRCWSRWRGGGDPAAATGGGGWGRIVLRSPEVEVSGRAFGEEVQEARRRLLRLARGRCFVVST